MTLKGVVTYIFTTYIITANVCSVSEQTLAVSVFTGCKHCWNRHGMTVFLIILRYIDLENVYLSPF